MTAYRPGQLYTGADGDLLFAVLSGDGIAFVTNRGTRVTVSEAARVYAPLTLARDVGRTDTATPEVRELAVAVRAALDLPFAEHNDPRADQQRTELLRDRAARVLGSMDSLLDHGALLAVVAAGLHRIVTDAPVQYAAKAADQNGGS